jgi:hypothetical protein
VSRWKTYWSGIRSEPHYRHDAFEIGLQNAGLSPDIAERADVLVIWNRYGTWAKLASACEKRGGLVLVAENASWGNEFAGERWYTIARGVHNTAGRFPIGGPERWDSLGVELASWREGKGETVILPSRGIGPPGVAMPDGWGQGIKGRVRTHPGTNACVPLDQDLARATRVVTWGSGAAIKALLWGIRVVSHMPQWIGEQDNTDAGRLAMFRRLAWAQWRVSEITTGEPFRRLCAP